MAGRIELITGPMFAGKTSELVQRMFRYGKRGYQYVIVPSVVPTKNGYIGTHNNHWILAEKSGDLEATFVRIFQSEENRALAKNPDGIYVPGENPLAVAIDEVQFFPPDIVPVVEKAAREWGWTIICAGLYKDFANEFWETTWELIKVADCVIRLHAQCAVCGALADRTQRLHLDGTPARTDEPRVVLSGDGVRYEPRCWRCHEIGK